MDSNKVILVCFICLGLIVTGCERLKVLPSANLGAEYRTLESGYEKSTPFTPTADILAADTQLTPEQSSPEVIRIPVGEFTMGSVAEVGFDICQVSRPGCSIEDFGDEGPVHQVFLDEFWIDQFEVTNVEYRRCVNAEECGVPAIIEFYGNSAFDRHPVVFVSWFQAEAFCHWAGGFLPTEAQWEKASRGTGGPIFPWGEDLECGYANLKGCTEGLTMEVGSLPSGASVYGVLDLAGNAAEWVADWYEPAYYLNSPSENPTGPDYGELKVARGGSWKNPFAGVRSTNRTANYPEVFSSGVGFRCAYWEKP